MFYVSEMDDSFLKSRIDYDRKEYLKNKNNNVDYEELKEIVLRYYNVIKQYIIEENTEKDLVMKDKKMKRHDLDIESHVDFEKIRQSIYTRSNKGLSFFEKRAKTVILLNAIEMIDIYGIEQLNNDQQNVEKEITYGSFLDRKMKKTSNEIEAYNKIGDMYGKESIKYFKDIFLLEERIDSLLSYNCTTQEREKLKNIQDRVNEIINLLPIDVNLVLQLRIAQKRINEKFCPSDNCWMDCPDIDSLKKVKETTQNKIDKITERHKRIISKINLDTNTNLNKSGFEPELDKYNEIMKIIDYYQKKSKQILMESQKNDSSGIENENICKELKKAYTEYCQINREMLIDRLYDKAPSVINSVDENKFMIVHFPTPESALEGKESSKDADSINLKNRIMRVLRAKVAKQNNRKYNRKKDRQGVKELYKESRNSFDFKHRIPVKIQYIANSLFMKDTANDENPYEEQFFMCLTKPTTNISMTAVKPGKLKPHRDRKIGYGCLKSSVSPESIYSIDKAFNLHNDIHIFEEDEYPISELTFETQETMVDWTKIKLDYIIVIKETKDFENSDIYRKAKEISEQTRLPLVVYDQYEIDKKNEIELIR